MRIRRTEFIAMAITLAVVCFMGGYFTGSRKSVNIVTASSQNEVTEQSAVIANTEQNYESAAPTTQRETAGIETPESVVSTDNESVDIEEQIVEPGAMRSGDGRININTASPAELTDLPGIGTVLAGRIVDYRTQYGFFAAIEDIMRVSGIGQKRFEALMDKITVG